ncbi:unnamed protein product [Prorocentrum cordatum]|uniref:Protein ENHANCED DISEASE RESISTANCE 2 C-terminal domain-containing protein n=1 Tax=Prorocentrum cordatum TaxID=2364126 RepID=A0ABN9WYC1_9DINO|nr:unnamed protein product [Polarella glacialis]
MGRCETPTLLGKALKLSYFHIPGDHFEVSINVFSEPKAKSITGLVSGAAKGLVIDMGLLIEGQAPQELPEQLLGGHRLRRINFAKLRSPV